jgi:GTP-dependent phosphoenolpyruvate carboxykinase
MQQKKIVLEKANEFIIWKETLLGKLSHIEFQFDANQANITLIDYVDKCSEEVELWKQNIDSIENLLQQSKTTIPGSSIADQFKEVELKLVNIQ